MSEVLTRTVSPADRLAMSLIRGYRRAVSPRKGFACAHRVLRGGASCSAFALDVVHHHGWRQGGRQIVRRFRCCAAAARVLRREEGEDAAAGRVRRMRRYRGQCCVVIPLPKCSSAPRRVPRV